MTRRQIGLAEALRVLKEFGVPEPGEAAKAEIESAVRRQDAALGMLGFVRTAPVRSAGLASDAGTASATSPVMPDVTPPKPAALASAIVISYNDALVEREPDAVTTLSWMSSAELLPRDDAGPAAAGPIDPLFTPAWQRAMVIAALNSESPSAEIDVEAVVERLSHGDALERLPVRRRRSLRGDIQIVVDESDEMRPYFEDQSQAIAAVAALFPVERIDLTFCKDGPPGTQQRQAYVAPAGGTTVLILTNFGLVDDGSVRPDLAHAWAAFGASLRRRGSNVIAFAPADPHRIPEHLRKTIAVVPWDRGTGVGTVARARTMVRGVA